MTDNYPLPSYAISLWHRGDGLVVQLPDGRQLMLPLERLQVDRQRADQRGWAELLGLLAARRDCAQRNERPALGSQASPLASELELALKGARKFQANGRRKLSAEDLWGDQGDPDGH